MRTRVIDRELAAGVDRIDFTTVDPTAAEALRGAAKGGAHLLTAGQLEALERQVKEEARKRGYEEGLAAGKIEAAARVARLEALAAAFTHPFQALDRAVEDEIVTLAVKLAGHLVRREIEHDPAILHTAVADCLAAQKVVGWFQGRMEYGPRALGARSILGDARSTSMQSTMNLKIKFRESFRPFAPSVLRERVHATELRKPRTSPWRSAEPCARADRHRPLRAFATQLGPMRRRAHKLRAQPGRAYRLQTPDRCALSGEPQ